MIDEKGRLFGKLNIVDLLVILVVFLSLQSWRATLIPIVAVPISLIGTFGVMLVFGFSLNMLTLLGLILAIGIVVVFLTRFTKSPAESCFFPALLPMIPGMYAYHTIEALLMCLYHSEEPVFNHYLYLLAYNGFTCTFIIIGMVVGATIPVFLLKKMSFQATR